MKQTNPEKNLSPEGWSLVGQLKRSADVISGASIDNWLIKTLEPFQLPPDLFHKLKASIAETLPRLSTNSETSRVPLVSVYVSQDVTGNSLSNKSWGFFKLEKVGVGSVQGAPDEHKIEYYLYLDI